MEMTDAQSAQTALDKLIEAVEAGEAWPREFDVIPYMQSRTDAIRAFNGSLDAALALHEAMLPGWAFTVNEDGAWTDERRGLRRLGFKGAAPTPARAWLLAILRAYRSTQP